MIYSLSGNAPAMLGANEAQEVLEIGQCGSWRNLA
jgi:hypothetical protein